MAVLSIQIYFHNFFVQLLQSLNKVGLTEISVEVTTRDFGAFEIWILTQLQIAMTWNQLLVQILWRLWVGFSKKSECWTVISLRLFKNESLVSSKISHDISMEEECSLKAHGHRIRARCSSKLFVRDLQINSSLVCAVIQEGWKFLVPAVPCSWTWLK